MLPRPLLVLQTLENLVPAPPPENRVRPVALLRAPPPDHLVRRLLQVVRLPDVRQDVDHAARDVPPGAELRRPVVPRERVVVVVPALAEGDEAHEVALGRFDGAVERPGAPQVGVAVHEPRDVQDDHVAEEVADEEGVPEGLVPEAAGDGHGEGDGEDHVEGLVVSGRRRRK